MVESCPYIFIITFYFTKENALIKYFTVENFKSIKIESILEFDTNLGKNYPYPASSVIGFAGANASGKTCILQAITFVFWFMQSSFLELKEDAHIPCEPFIGQDELPSKFHVIFTQKNLVENEEKYVDYEYKLTLFPDRVVREELYYYPYGRPRKAYFREENQIQFGDSVKHLDKESILNFRQNCSFVSFAAQFSSQEEASGGMQN